MARIIPGAAHGAGTTSGQRGRIIRLAAGSAAVTYLVLFSAYLLTSGGWPTPDYLIPPLLLVAIAMGRGWSFLFDWSPFLVLILAWQASAGVADQMGYPIHVHPMIRADRWLFGGHLPTVELQERLYHPGAPRWYDWLAAGQHAAHFALPVAAGIVLWLRGRRVYWRYIASLMTVFFLGYAGYVLYPAAPPWMAAENGIIPPVHRVAVETMQRFAATQPVGLAYLHMNANPVAAMPSLHAALPMLVALVAIRLWGRRAVPALLYPFAMGYNVVYLGEHYVVDVLAGYTVAIVGFTLVWLLPEALPSPRVALRLPSPRVPVLARRLGDVALLAAAAAALVVIGSSLHLRPAGAPEASVVQSPSGAVASPAAPCGLAEPLTAAVEGVMDGVAEDYAVYLIDTSSAACYTLVDHPDLPPPAPDERNALAAAATASAEPSLSVQDGDLLAKGIGRPAPALAAAGVPADRDYLLVIRLHQVNSADAAERAAGKVADLAFGSS